VWCVRHELMRVTIVLLRVVIVMMRVVVVRNQHVVVLESTLPSSTFDLPCSVLNLAFQHLHLAMQRSQSCAAQLACVFSSSLVLLEPCPSVTQLGHALGHATFPN
jgi:hypothetical protein